MMILTVLPVISGLYIVLFVLTKHCIYGVLTEQKACFYYIIFPCEFQMVIGTHSAYFSG